MEAFIEKILEQFGVEPAKPPPKEENKKIYKNNIIIFPIERRHNADDT